MTNDLYAYVILFACIFDSIRIKTTFFLFAFVIVLETIRHILNNNMTFTYVLSEINNEDKNCLLSVAIFSIIFFSCNYNFFYDKKKSRIISIKIFNNNIT